MERRGIKMKIIYRVVIMVGLMFLLKNGIKQKVEEDEIGIKTKKGFYE